MVMTQATTAVANTIPGGSAVGIGMTYGMLGSWGYSRSGTTTTAVLVSGVWNSFVKLGLPVLALVLVLLQGGAGGGRVTAALLGIAGVAAGGTGACGWVGTRHADSRAPGPFIRTPNFAPDGRRRPGKTLVGTAVGRHLLARRKSELATSTQQRWVARSLAGR